MLHSAALAMHSLHMAKAMGNDAMGNPKRLPSSLQGFTWHHPGRSTPAPPTRHGDKDMRSAAIGAARAAGAKCDDAGYALDAPAGPDLRAVALSARWSLREWRCRRWCALRGIPGQPRGRAELRTPHHFFPRNSCSEPAFAYETSLIKYLSCWASTYNVYTHRSLQRNHLATKGETNWLTFSTTRCSKRCDARGACLQSLNRMSITKRFLKLIQIYDSEYTSWLLVGPTSFSHVSTCACTLRLTPSGSIRARSPHVSSLS